MLHLYWSIGEDIVTRKAETVWGEGVAEQLSQDLQDEFPNMKGFSRRNLFYIKKWYLFYSQEDIKVQQVVAKIDEAIFSIPWKHQMHLLAYQSFS